MAVEDRSEVARYRIRNFLQRKWIPEFLSHGRDRLRVDPTRDDQIKVVQIGVYVQREAVRGDAAGDVDADRCDLGAFAVGESLGLAWTVGGGLPHVASAVSQFCGASPYTGQPRNTLGGDSEISAGAD